MTVLESGQRLAIFGVFVNGVLAVAKVGAGTVGNSYALIADGVESLMDVGGSLVIWSGLKLAGKPPDRSHPYGHGKAEPLAAAFVALAVLFAAVFLAVQSVREIWTPHHAPEPFTLAVLLVVIAIKETLFRYVVKHAKGSTAIMTDAWHHRADAFTSLAAFFGISIALIGGEGYESADDYAALLACGVIAYNGVTLLIPALKEAMDTAPPEEIVEQVRQEALKEHGVEAIDKCVLRKMGFGFYVDIHVHVRGDLSVREGHQIAHAVKDRLRGADLSVFDVLVHIEPSYGPSPEPFSDEEEGEA